MVVWERTNCTSTSSEGLLRVGRNSSTSLWTVPLLWVLWLVALIQVASADGWSSLSTSSRSPRLQTRNVGSSKEPVRAVKAAVAV